MANRTSFVNSKTAFVILAWNSEKYIEACVKSVLGLNCAKLDVFIVDNGSTDATGSILAKIAAVDTRLHVITKPENLGTTVTRNEGVNLAPKDTDYICVLDSDTVVNQEAFESLAEVLADESIGVVGPTMATSAGVEQLSGRNLPTMCIKLGKAAHSKKAAAAEIPSTPVVDNKQDVGYLLSACWLLPMESINKVGLLDEKIFYSPEDVDWCVRCHKAGLRVVRDWNAHIVHEYQRLSHKKLISKTNFEHVKGLAYYFKKHGYLFKAPVFINK